MPRFTIKSLLWRLARIILLAYCGLVAALWIFQRQIIYHPDHAPEASLLSEAQIVGAQPWRDAGGETIGWTRAMDPKHPAVNRLLVFHGNTGYALMRLPFIDGFGQLDNSRLWQVYLFEYPGYGARPGAITEPAFRDAAASAIKLLQASDSRPIYLMGESLGSGLACAAAHDFAAAHDQPAAIAGLLLVTPLSSLRDVAGAHYPYVPVGLLLRDHWDNVTALSAFHGRIAVTLAGSDTIIPIREGRRLFAAANEPKRLWIEPGADHNDIDYSLPSPWWREVSDFLLASAPANH